MSQALIVSDSETICAVYEMNLNTYVATDATSKETVEEAKRLVDRTKNFDLVICSFQNDQKSGPIEQFIQYLVSETLIPIVITGPLSSQFKDKKIINIQDSYDIKSLLKTVSQILGVTAKEMAQRPVPDYFPFSLQVFRFFDAFPCDVYFKISTSPIEHKYYRVFEKDGPVSLAKINKIYSEGHEVLYIPSPDRLKFTNSASQKIFMTLTDTTISSSKKIEATERGFELTASSLFEDNQVTDEIVQMSSKCVKAVDELVNDMPDIEALLKELIANKSGFLYAHMVIAAYVSSKIIEQMSWGSKEQAEKLNFVFFFHDIHLAPIMNRFPEVKHEEDLLFNTAMNVKDKEVVLNHAQLAAQTLSKYPKMPMGADLIIKQHHGITNGIGFANDFKENLSPLSKVVIVAEEITRHILDKDKEIDSIVNKISSKFKRSSYKKIIEAFQKTKI